MNIDEFAAARNNILAKKSLPHQVFVSLYYRQNVEDLKTLGLLTILGNSVILTRLGRFYINTLNLDYND